MKPLKMGVFWQTMGRTWLFQSFFPDGRVRNQGMSCSLGAGILFPARVCQGSRRWGWIYLIPVGCCSSGLRTQMWRQENHEGIFCFCFFFFLRGFFCSFWHLKGLWWLGSSSGSTGYFFVFLLSLLGLLNQIFLPFVPHKNQHQNVTGR